MRLHLSVALCLASLLAACSSTPPAAVADTAATLTDVASCQAAGGQLQPLGRLQRVQCVVPYADAGKQCSNKSDCSGRCLAGNDVVAGMTVTGTCQRDISETFGCRQPVDGGVAQGVICID